MPHQLHSPCVAATTQFNWLFRQRNIVNLTSDMHQPAKLKELEKINPFRVMTVMHRAAALEAEGRKIVHMEVGEPDFDTATPIIEAAKNALDAALRTTRQRRVSMSLGTLWRATIWSVTASRWTKKGSSSLPVPVAA